MKLTEQQLAQMFQQNRDTAVESNIDNLYASGDASDERLADVEKIADNSTLSASYHIMNQLHDWSQAIGNDINLSLKPKFSFDLFTWLRPTIATAAIATAVYFVAPTMNNNSIQQVQHAQHVKSDVIMHSSSFESKSDIINGSSFDKPNSVQQSDTISQVSFG